MPFNISQFQQALTYDGARPNLFSVEIPTFDQKLTFTCKAAQLPGSTLGTIEVPYMGRMVKYAGNRTFADWQIQIINDEDFVIRHQLESWMSTINSHEENIASTTSNGYSFPAYVSQLTKNGDVARRYTFVGTFPIDISPIDLDWGSNDVIEEYSVTLAYQYWQAFGAGSEVL